MEAAFFEAQIGPFAKRGFEWRVFDYMRFKIMAYGVRENWSKAEQFKYSGINEGGFSVSAEAGSISYPSNG